MADTDTIILICILLLCLAFSSFFSGIEMGVISANPLRLMHLARTGNKRAKILERYLKDPDRLLSTILAGNNIVNQIFATVITALFLHHFGQLGSTLSAFVSTIVILIFGEYLPKTLYSARPITRSLPFARLLTVIEIVLWPLSRLMVLLSGFMVDRDKDPGTQTKMITREHLQWLAQNSGSAGQISSLESLMIGRTLALERKSVKEIMTPIDSVLALTPYSTLKNVLDYLNEFGHNKYPIINKANGECMGILYVQDILARIIGNQDDNVMEFVRQPFFINDETRADDVLPQLRKNRTRMGIVRDRENKIIGVVTIDGILASIVDNLPKSTSSDRAADKDAAIVFNASGKITG